MNRLIEIRTYRLTPGTAAAFHELVSGASVPLLKAAGTDVVAFGSSLHDTVSYYLIRAYENLDHLRTAQDTFYASAAWRQGPREAIIKLIEADTNAVLWLGDAAIDGLRQAGAAQPV